MAKGINIAIGADTRAYADAVKKGLIDPTEEAADALVDLGRKGPRDLDRVEDAMRDAQDETEKVKKELGELTDELRNAGRRARPDFARPMEDATGDAKRSLGEFKDEAKANFAEVASSFDGTAEGIADGIQGTLGGASMAIGGAAGLGIGLLGAAGGTIMAQLQADAEAMKEATSAAFTEMAENGVEAFHSIEAQNQRLRTAYDEHEGDINKIAELTGLSFETVASAWAGNAEAVELVRSAYGEMTTDLRSTAGVSVEAANATIAGWDGVLKPLENTIEGYERAEEKATRLWGQIVQDTDEATHQTRIYSDELRRVPTSLPLRIDVPDASAVRNALQRKLNNLGPVRVDAAVYTRNGTPVF